MHPAPEEASTFPTLAAWWAATNDAGAMARVLVASGDVAAKEADPVRRRLAGMVGDALKPTIRTLDDTSPSQVIRNANTLLGCIAGAADVNRAEVIAASDRLQAVLAVEDAVESGGPAWAATARALRSTLRMVFDRVEPQVHAEAAIDPLVAARTIRAAFPTPPSNVADPA